MDSELCQINRLYLMQLSGYNKVVLQRNKLLKDLSFSDRMRDTLDIWDQQMISYGQGIIGEREAFIRQVNSVLKEIHKNITGGREEIELIYEPNVEKRRSGAKTASGERERSAAENFHRGTHRDDFCVMVNGIDIRKFGSQGQQRSAALSLKLSEIDLVRSMIHDQRCSCWTMCFQNWTAAGRNICFRASEIYRRLSPVPGWRNLCRIIFR